MAIKGLVPQLAERGKIKIGEKGEMKQSQDGKQFAQPKKLDHFIITTVQRDAASRLIEDRDLMTQIKEAQGNPPKLTEIPVRLLYDDIDLNFLTRYSAYSGTRCWCSGDGEQAERLNDQKKYEARPCPCEHLDATYTGSPKCKPLGTLQVLLKGVDRVGGVWKFRTTSWNTVNAILSSLALIKTLTGGPLAGIPLTMVLSPKTVIVPTTGHNMVVYVVSLEYRGPEEQLAKIGYDIAKRRIEHQVRMDNIEAEARRLLVAPHQEAPLEQQETAEEFYPEGVTTEIRSEITDAKKTEVQKGQDPELTTESASTQMQEGKSKEDLTWQEPPAEIKKALTFPELMEACKSKTCITFPVPIRTTKDADLGEMVDRAVSGDTQTLILELRPDLPKVSDGLTEEIIAKHFKEAGIKIIFQPPGTFKEGPPKKNGDGEGNGGGHSELAGGAAQAAAATATAETKKKAPAKALF